MKINSVTASGFGPFKSKQCVDFTAFDGEGLFLISGKTGAGKSSILDAVTFALYGSTPRYDGHTEARYRSDHVGIGEDTEVSVDFTVADGRYRVTRSPEYSRPKQRGGGETRQPARAVLEIHTPTGWEGKAALPRDVGPLVQELVGLNVNQFLQVMLLAQNRFQEFLVADTKDRRALLKRLFGAERFEDYENRLDEKRRALEGRANKIQATRAELTRQLVELVNDSYSEAECSITANTYVGFVAWLDAINATCVTSFEQAQQAVQDADKNLNIARQHLTALAETERLQKKQTSARAVLTEIAQLRPRIENWRAQLERNERSLRAIPSIRVAEKAATALHDTTANHKGVLGKLVALNPLIGCGVQPIIAAAQVTEPEIPIATVQACRDQVLGRKAEMQQALTAEAEMPAIEAAAQSASTLLKAKQEKRVGLLAQVAAGNDAVVEAEATIKNISAKADQLALREAEEATTKAVLAAALAAQDARQKLDTAERVALVTAGEQQQTAAEVKHLWEMRFQGYAAELAADLKPGLPCRVCGATAHPAPAKSDEQHVTLETLQVAQERADQAAAKASAASNLATKLAAESARLSGLAGNITVADAQAAAAQARANLAEAKLAVEQRDKIVKNIEQLRAAIQTASAQAETLVHDIQEASVNETAAAASLVTARQLVAIGAGGFPTVTARAEALAGAESTLAAYIEVTQALEYAQNNSQRAQSDLKQVLSEQAFATAAEAKDGALTEQEQSDIIEQLRDIEHREVAARADLADPALAEVPSEPVDTQPAAQVVLAAQSAAATASEHLGVAVQQQKQLTNLGDQAKAAYQKEEKIVVELNTVKRLSDTIRGNAPNDRRMRLIDYVLAAELEQIVAAANVRLKAMRNGRYLLEHSDAKAKGLAQSGLGLQVMDSHTGVARPTHSLSGGEKFLASLALALGLAETVANRAGGITLDTLFIDEGFGSLDDVTLEIAMETLDSLRENGRTVGVISHVGLMHERIPAQVMVTVTPGGWSEVSQL